MSENKQIKISTNHTRESQSFRTERDPKWLPQTPIIREPKLKLLILDYIVIEIKALFKTKTKTGASLMAQWFRVCLLMQGTRVRALVWEDPTCRGATGPVSHNCWAWVSGACALRQEKAAIVRGPRTAMKGGPCLPQLEEALAQKWRPNTAKKKYNK